MGSVRADISNHITSYLSMGWTFLHLPALARLPSFVRHGCAGKVDRMKTPQQLSRQAIDEFKAIYQEEFGETLTDDQVQEMALSRCSKA